jgi:hypothetical protein
MKLIDMKFILGLLFILASYFILDIAVDNYDNFLGLMLGILSFATFITGSLIMSLMEIGPTKK